MPKQTHRNPDHVQRHNTPSPNNEVIANQLEALLTPAIFAQQGYYRQLGLRERILNLSLMVAAVLTLLWRRFSGRAGVNSLACKRKLTVVPCY